MLEALHPRKCSLDELTWFDYLVVHTSDMEGPESLHPDFEASVGEMLVRRRLVEQSIALLRKLHLVVADYHDGLNYLPGDEAPAIIDLLTSPYNQNLKARADWVSKTFRNFNHAEVEEIFADRIGRWTAEFRTNEHATSASL
ncbi:hypothetical protein FSZ31_00970 [Sphingorhabdus soli]|uniref:Threonine transporter n=1 Tax=Flavisphingopyxis soli TaxID=2601267 RepID=A0A5C6UP57_9SPHN|nr:hypothetical protein FSZ31_00970 [Sphingorhabdus soli]